MQYIGHKDKNDKEIYEEFIIKYLWGCSIHGPKIFIRKVEWDEQLAGYLPFIDLDNECGCKVHLESIEILGNNFENPELIK